MKALKDHWRWLVGGLLLLCLISARPWFQVARLNWANLVVNRGWLTLVFQGNQDTPLQDGVPDGWTPGIWGGQGRAIHALDTIAHGGKYSASIRRTNKQDFAVYGQPLTLPRGEEIHCGVYSRGSAAFIQVVRDGGTIGYANLPASETWKLTEMHFASPPDGGRATLYLGLGPTDQVWFDDAYCYAAVPGLNLLSNGGFEVDGVDVDPWTWWRSRVMSSYDDSASLQLAAEIIASSSVESGARTNRLNILDLLTGRPNQVRERMQAGSTGCPEEDGGPSILLGLRTTAIAEGGVATFERLAQLAILLMPRCPQSYTELGDMYSKAGAYEKAAESYQVAADLARPGPQRGAYAFALGRQDAILLGNWDRAINAFSMAEQNAGWETAPWYYGAAAAGLGEALQAVGRCAEARAAYERVLDCRACGMQHAEAQAGLKRLSACAEP